MDSLPTSTLSIRKETPPDIPDIRELNRRAFGRDDEAALVDRLRDDGDVLLSLAALEMGRVVGHVLFSRLPIERAGATAAAAALAPIAVEPDHQGRGIGSMLIMRGLTMLRRMDIEAVVVVGDPGYYERFGFRPELAASLESPYAGDASMALELVDGALAGGGKVCYGAAFSALS